MVLAKEADPKRPTFALTASLSPGPCGAPARNADSGHYSGDLGTRPDVCAGPTTPRRPAAETWLPFPCGRQGTADSNSGTAQNVPGADLQEGEDHKKEATIRATHSSGHAAGAADPADGRARPEDTPRGQPTDLPRLAAGVSPSGERNQHTTRRSCLEMAQWWRN